MIESTFVFLKGVGPSTERRIWEFGVEDWQAFLACPFLPGIASQRKNLYDANLSEAVSHLEAGHSRYFTKRLKASEHWRLFDAFKSNALYLDIETTGDPPDQGDVTVVGLYRCGEMISLVQGDTLTEDRLNEEFARAALVVTFFGSVFDLPYLRAKFPGLVCDQPHFDLCFAGRRLGFEGGLKRIEATLGIQRESDIQGLDGWQAVQLWQEWRGGIARALDLLLRYNESDTRNLEPLAELIFGRLAERYGPSRSTTRLATHEHTTDV